MKTVSCFSIKSPVGDLTIFATDGAIVALEWGHVPKDAPGAGAVPTPLLKKAAHQIEQYFAGTRTRFDVPLTPHGTAFQKKVWREMTKIPHGQTRTYGAIAKKLQSAARAVGGACGQNPIPVLIPCHRVVGAAGLGGFSGGAGIETKIRLLTHEGGMPKKA